MTGHTPWSDIERKREQRQPRQRPRVYVAGVISADPVGGVRDAIDAFFLLWDAGYAPFVPHLDLLLQLQRPLPWADWLEYDFRWVEVCDAVYRIPGQVASPGADRECSFAEALGIPVARAGLAALRALCPPADGFPLEGAA